MTNNVEFDCRVLDGGFVRVYTDPVCVLGDDRTIVNAARVSFAKRIGGSILEDDKKLLRYLAKNQHTSPFRHASVQFHVKAPEFVTRQWYKHVVGSEITSIHPTKDHAWNEISGRYVSFDEFEIHYPDAWRSQSKSSKQGSGSDLDQLKTDAAHSIYHTAIVASHKAYNALLDIGVAKEQARLVLPMSFYTEFYWTATFQSIMHFCDLRTDSHAQSEIRQYADAILDIMKKLFPFSTEAWLESKLK